MKSIRCILLALVFVLGVGFSAAQDNYTLSFDAGDGTTMYLDNEGRGLTYTADNGTQYDAKSRPWHLHIPVSLRNIAAMPGGSSASIVITELTGSTLDLMESRNLPKTENFSRNGQDSIDLDIALVMRSVCDQADSFATSATSGNLINPTGATSYLLELKDSNQNVVDSITMVVAYSGSYRHGNNAPTGPVTFYSSLGGTLTAQPNDGSTALYLYGSNIPASRPDADGPATVDVDLAGWTIQNDIGEPAELVVETVDDLPLFTITPIGTGQTSDYGIFAVPPGAQIRIDQVVAADQDPSQVTVLHTGGTQTYTVPAQGGTWTSSWTFALPGNNTDYVIKLNITNAQTVGATVDVLYNSIISATFPLSALATGQQQLAEKFTLSAPAPLGLTFASSVGTQVTVINGPTTLSENFVNVYDIAVTDGGNPFTVTDQITQTVSEDGELIHQGGTYERDLGNGESIYWSTDGLGDVGSTVIDPTTQGNSGNLPGPGVVGGDTGTTPEEDQARDDASSDLDGLQTEFDAIKDTLEGETGIGQLGNLVDGGGTIGAGLGRLRPGT